MDNQPPQGTPTPPHYNPNQPVAYDQYGRPLYAHPPTVYAAPPPQVVHVTKTPSPAPVHVPEELQRRHEEAKKQFPELNLSAGEYVILTVSRHPIGVIEIWSIITVLIAAFASLFGLTVFSDGISIPSLLFMLGVVVLFCLGGMIATNTYKRNKFYLTNESVIQHIQSGPMLKNEQTISLANIEDASYKRGGVLQSIFNYGVVRLSTEGEETTYRFGYVGNPKRVVSLLNNAIEAFKNGHPFYDE